MASTGQTLTKILNKAEDILERTVIIYQQNCEIKGYKINFKILTKDEDGFVYQLQVSEVPITTIRIYRNININLGDQIISASNSAF